MAKYPLPEEVRKSVDELNDDEKNEIKQRIMYVFDNRIAEDDSFYIYNITTDVLFALADEVISENTNYFYVLSVRVSYSADFYKKYNIKWARRLKVDYYDKCRNIRRNSRAETPDRILRCVNGQLIEPDRIYKCINGKLELFWEK